MSFYLVYLLWLKLHLLPCDCSHDIPVNLGSINDPARRTWLSNSLKVRSNWSKHPRTSVAALLLLCGDIHPNPGPPKYPCGVCSRSVRSNQQGILCEVCYKWFHTRCLAMPCDAYQSLGASDEAWCCPSCLKEALPFHDCSQLSVDCVLPQATTDSPQSQACTTATHLGHQCSQCSILYANCCSILPKLDSLRTYASSTSPDIIALCETWLDDTVSDSEVFIPGYCLVRRDRNRHGGGVLLYLHESIPIISASKHPSIELLVVEVEMMKGPLTIGVYYRPPSSPPNLTDLESALQSLNPSKLRSAILLGDFNINLFSATPLSKEVISSLSAFHLHQVVTEPTRVTDSLASLIDHVYVSDPSLLLSCSTTPPLDTSDHHCILTLLKYPPRPQCRSRRSVWRYALADWDAVNNHLNNLPFSLSHTPSILMTHGPGGKTCSSPPWPTSSLANKSPFRSPSHG